MMNNAGKKLEEIARKAHKELNEKMEGITEEQLSTCFKQAIESGDFLIHITESNKGYGMTVSVGVTYSPYRERVRLLKIIKNMQKELKDGGHDKGCRIYNYLSSYCSCGLSQMLEEV